MRAVAANVAVERLSDQQSLIAVGQAQERASERHQALQKARPEAGIVERKPERGGGQRPFARVDGFHEGGGLALPPGLQDRVGVQEQEPWEARPVRPGHQLISASAAAREERCARLVGDRRSRIAGAAIDDDHLPDETVDGRRHERRQRLRQKPPPRSGTE